MKKDDLEYNICDEYTKLPDEFNRTESKAVEPDKSGKKLWKKMIYMVTALSVIVYCAVIPFNLDALSSAEENNRKHMSGDIETPVGESQSEEPQQEETKEQNNTSVPEVPVYPLEDDVISFVTIYNDSYDPVDYNNIILRQDAITYAMLGENGYSMPAYEQQDGFIFMGWVLYYEKNMEEGHRVEMIGDALTGDDFLHIKPESGSRPVEIHAAWRKDGIGEWADMLTLNANGGTIEGSSFVTYDAKTPMGSGGIVYLCAYPVPVRDGYTFTGWYENPDCSGNRQTLVYSIEFFERTDEGIDWSASKPITLYAGWAPQ